MTTTSLSQALRQLPPELETITAMIATLLERFASNPASRDEIQREVYEDPTIFSALQQLSGTNIEVNSSVLSLAKNGQTGDITIGKVGTNNIQIILSPYQAAMGMAPDASTDPLATDDPLAYRLESGRRSYQKHVWTKAIEDMEAALALDPGHEEALELLSRAQRHQALAEFSAEAQNLRALKRWEEHARVWFSIKSLRQAYPHLEEENPQPPFSFPYPIQLSEDIKLHKAVFQRLARQNKHLAPHLAEVVSMWAVLTRLEAPREGDLTLLAKMRLYDGVPLPGYTPEAVKRLRREYPMEGFVGVSSRYIHDTVSQLLARFPYYAADPCITPFMIFPVLESGLEKYEQVEATERARYIELLQVVRDEYASMLRDELAQSLLDEDALPRLFQTYLSHLKAHVMGEKVRNRFTGQYEAPDERLMRSVEEQINISEADKDSFRSVLLNRIAAMALEGQPIDISTFDYLQRAIKRKLFGEQEAFLIKYSFIRGITADEPTKARLEAIKGRFARRFGYCERCAEDAFIYVLSMLQLGKIRLT